MYLSLFFLLNIYTRVTEDSPFTVAKLLIFIDYAPNRFINNINNVIIFGVIIDDYVSLQTQI